MNSKNISEKFYVISLGPELWTILIEPKFELSLAFLITLMLLNMFVFNVN